VTRVLLLLAALALARLLPQDGAGLYLRLAAATAALLVPFAGAGPSTAVAWMLGALFCSLAVTFAVHASLGLALGIFAVLAVGAAVARTGLGLSRPATAWYQVGARFRAMSRGDAASYGLVLVAGVAFGIALWRLAGPVQGDALFHLGRIRKLDDLGSLSLHAVDEFRDGGLHPGYAFPLWHGFLAFVARLAGVDPTEVVRHESSLLCPVLFLVVYEAGRIVFRSAAMGWAVLAAQVSLAGLAAGHGGAFPALALPASVSQFLLPAAALALVFRALEEPGRERYAALASIGLGLALVHPTYALFLVIVLAGFLAARALLAGADLRALGGALLALALPAAAVGLWLRPLVRESNRSVHGLAHGVERYPGQIDIFGPSSFRLAPDLIDRRGALAVAALALVPLAALARRTRWAAFVLGGTVILLALSLWPFLFVHFAHAVSISQARRAVGFLPLSFALAGGAAVLARFLGPLVLPVALVAGILLQRSYPGNFGYVFGSGGGPPVVVWWALFAGAAVLAVAALARPRFERERSGLIAGLAVILLCLPVAVHGFSHWSPTGGGQQELTPGLVQAIRTKVPEGAVVFSDPETSYRISAYAPVYVASSAPAHVADTRANRPYARQRDALRFMRTGDLAIPRRYGAEWIVLDRKRTRLKLDLPRVYADGRYSLYRL
jgi:hypothetical protein